MIKSDTNNIPQIKRFNKSYGNESVEVTVRYGDECGNGHNTLSVTYAHYVGGKEYSCGSNTGFIVKWFPELAELARFHLVSTSGPLHYKANTIYHAENDALASAQACAIWPDATYAELLDTYALEQHLFDIMKSHHRIVSKELGFIY